MGFDLKAVLRHVGEEIRLILQWWRHELHEALHAALVRSIPTYNDRVSIAIRGARAEITWKQSGREDSIATHALDHLLLDPTLWTAGLSEVPKQARTRLDLDPTRVLLRDVVLPAAVERDLSRAVALQAERVLPLPLQSLYVDWRIKRRLPNPAALCVTIAACRRNDIDALRESLERGGLKVTETAVLDPQSGHQYSLAETRLALRMDPWSRADQLLTAGLAGVVLIGLALFGAKTFYEHHRIGAILAEAHVQAASARHLEQQIRASLVPIEALSQLAELPTAVDFVATLTEAIPADSWVYSAEIVAGAGGADPVVKLSGFTPTATMLVEHLAKAPALRSVRLVRAAASSGGIGIDQFEISARLATSRSATDEPQEVR